MAHKDVHKIATRDDIDGTLAIYWPREPASSGPPRGRRSVVLVLHEVRELSSMIVKEYPSFPGGSFLRRCWTAQLLHSAGYGAYMR